MFCQNCHSQISEDAKFCGVCGKSLNGQHNDIVNNAAKHAVKGLLFNEDENIISILGNNTVQKFVSTGIIGNGFAVLTDKRMYFKGKCLIRKGKGFYSKHEEKAVNLDDITGTGFVYSKATWAKVLCGIFIYISINSTALFIMSVLDAIFNETTYDEKTIGFLFFVFVLFIVPIALSFVFYFLYKRYNFSAFEISYAGGGIAFDIHWITKTEATDFQKQLSLIKDSLKEKQIKSEINQSISIPEQLFQYNNLLEQGIITQDEFNEKKKQLLK